MENDWEWTLSPLEESLQGISTESNGRILIYALFNAYKV